MIVAPDSYKRALRHAHESIIRVTAYEGTTEIGDLEVVSLDMTLDATTNIHRTASIVVAVDPLKTESRDALEAVSTTAGKVVIKHGVGYGGNPVDNTMVTLATLRVEEMSGRLTEATRTLQCYDRTLLLSEYTLPTARPLNDTYANLIQTLVSETLPGESVTVASGIDTTKTPAAGKAFNRGDDRLARIQELAGAIDAWLICDEYGAFHLTHAPGTDAASAQDSQWHFDTGTEGVLIDSESIYSRREQYNAISLEFTPSDEDWGSAHLFMWDNDPTSPTYFDGDFGKRVLSLSEEYDHLPSVNEAERVGRRKLWENSGATRAIRVTAVYNPLLLPGDKITVDVEDTNGGFTTETHFIEKINFGFGGTAAMDLDTRLYRTPGGYGMLIDGVPSGVGWGGVAISGVSTGSVP